MKEDLVQHGVGVMKVTGGAVSTAGGVYLAVSLTELVQYATLAAAMMTAFYYMVASVLAILQALKKSKSP